MKTACDSVPLDDSMKKCISGRSVSWSILCAALGTLALAGYVAANRDRDRLTDRAAGMWHAVGGLMNHYDANDRILPAVQRDECGRPLCSWRLRTRRLIEQESGYIDKYELPWYAQHNMLCIRLPFADYYTLPSGSDASVGFQTRIAAITGPGTVFDLPEGYDGPISEDYILLIECGVVDAVWSQPGDLDIGDVTDQVVQGIDGKGLMVGFVDGKIWQFRDDIPRHTLLTFLTIHGARQHDREKELLPYRKGYFSPPSHWRSE